MLENVILLVFAALVSSFLWWRTRFKICRRCRSRIRRWALFATSVVRSSRTANKAPDKIPLGRNSIYWSFLLNQIFYSPCSKNETLPCPSSSISCDFHMLRFVAYPLRVEGKGHD